MSAATASRRAVLVLAAAVVAGIVPAGAAQAHSTLVSTDPADGSTVAVAPARVTLTLNEPARSLGTEVVVTAPDATTVSSGDAVVDGAVVSQDLTGVLPAGTYTVTWRVTSADGHPLEGVLSFTATGATTLGGDPAATVTPRPTSLATPSAPASTPSTPAPRATPAITSTAPAGGTEIGPAAGDREADSSGATLGVVVAATAGVVLVLAVAATVVVRRRRARAHRPRSAGA